MEPEISAVAKHVQHNCHISDALYARNYTLCIYLLKMREFYRWEKGYALSDRLPHDDVGEWITEREQLWEGLEDTEFAPIPLSGTEFDPFDSEGIDGAVRSAGLVYSSGLGSHAKPLFFLGRLVDEDERDGQQVVVAGDELARDITAPPAMSRGGTILVRRESLQRMLWEKAEEWGFNRRDNPMGRALAAYGFGDDAETALERMTDREIESAILHELGELDAGRVLGDGWERLLFAVSQSRAEHILRAIRDHLADATVTLPALLDRGDAASLHFYFANLTGLRRALWPALTRSYDGWVTGAGSGRLEAAVAEGRTYWRELAEGLLAAERADDPAAVVESATAELLE